VATQRPDTIPELDIVSHDVYERGLPHDAYRRFRDEAPVAWIGEGPHNGHHGRGFWSLTRHADVVAAHKDWRTFSSEVGGTEIEELDADAIVARRTMLETDPPRHTALRQLVNPAFSRAAMLRHEDSARSIVGELFDALPVDGTPVDAVESIARQLPIRMLTDILGVPVDDAPRLFHWADQIVYHADPDFAEVVSDRDDTDPYRLLPFRSPVSLRVFAEFQRLVELRRRHPAGDVISVLADAEVGGAPLAERERDTFLLLLLIAGNETTRHSLTHAFLAFADAPDQLARLRSDASLIETAVEEVLRTACPQLHFRRTATVDTELGGQHITTGDKVVTWYLAANTDPEAFEDPMRFDVARAPNRHVTFGGGGPHLCLGQWMARLEVRVLLEVLIERNLRIERAGQVRRIRSNFINGIAAAPVRLVTSTSGPPR
jgi:cytochrome P450